MNALQNSTTNRSKKLIGMATSHDHQTQYPANEARWTKKEMNEEHQRMD
jgi:hypothetical protein